MSVLERFRRRKGVRRSGLPVPANVLRMAAENKDSVITVSLLLYVAMYLSVSLAGIGFQVQPAGAYVQTSENTACPGGSVWVEGSDLHWCDGSTEYDATDESGDQIVRVGSVSGDPGSIWVEGSELHWIDSSGVEYYHTGGDSGDNPGGSSGSIWVEDGRIHYIDANGNERLFWVEYSEGFESYSDGDTPSSIWGWSAGADCGTCQVSNDRAEDGSLSFYQNVGSTDDWQDVLIKDLSSTPIKHFATVRMEYWETSSNHDGNIWVRACDGTNLAGIGTENPQFEWVTNSASNTNNPGADYRDWTNVRMEIDLDAATVDFVFQQDGGESWTVTGKSIPSGKDICTVGVGPDDVWYVDDILINGY